MKNLFFILLWMAYTLKSYAEEASVLSAAEDLFCEPPPSIEHGSVRVISQLSNQQLMVEIGNESSVFLKPKLGHENNYLHSEEMNLFLPLETKVVYPSESVAEYHCEDGFSIKPSSTARRMCIDGNWLGETPYCVAKGCPYPKSPVNGYYLELSEPFDNLYPTGSRLQFLCHSGYLLQGPDSFTCQANDRWSPTNDPKCLPSSEILSSKKCPLPPDIERANQKLDKGVVGAGGAVQGTVVEYRCHFGFRNIISPCVTHTLTCHQGEWHGTSPQCKEFSSCIAPPNIANGYMYKDASSYSLRSQVYYSCDQGYRLVGPSVLTCEETGCWTPSLPPICQLNHFFTDDSSERPFSIHTLLIAAISGIIAVLFLLLVLIFYHRAVSPKLMRLRNSGSRNELEPRIPPNYPPLPDGLPMHDPDRVALIAFHDELLPASEGVPPTYEEAVGQRPNLQNGRFTPHTHRSRNHRVVVSGVRRSRHRDNPDNISYQSIGSARQSSNTSRSMSVRSWSGCNSLGSTDTVTISDSTDVTVDTMSSGTASSGVSQTPSCRGLAGSRTSFDTSSLMNTEGTPLLEETEVEGEDQREVDQYSLCTRDSESFKDDVSTTRSVPANALD